MPPFNRAAVPEPACLRKYKLGRDTWESVSHLDRSAIRAALRLLQGPFCAYCQDSLTEETQHIEHFRPRKTHRSLTFSWENLLLSCNRNHSCGSFKDRGLVSYNPAHIIDPCVESFNAFLLYDIDGSVAPKPDLKYEELARADKTIQVLNLRETSLALARASVVKAYIPMLSDIKGSSSEDRAMFVTRLLEKARRKPFFPVVFELLENLLEP